MYKKFLVSMLLTMALAGCGHQSSDKQGDQTDTALPVQDQITNPTPMGQEQQPVGPSTAEPTQPPPPPSTDSDTTQSGAGTNMTTPPPTTTNPDTSSTTIPTPPPVTDKDTATSTDTK